MRGRIFYLEVHAITIPALHRVVMIYNVYTIIFSKSGTCTLREAIIVGSVITKTSIPVLHASAAMLKLAEMDYSGK